MNMQKRTQKLNHNIIFLDIDGVLTSERAHRSDNSRYSRVWSKFDHIAIDFLNNLYNKHDINFVLCSTWRKRYDTRAMNQILWSSGFEGDLLASTDKHLEKDKSIVEFVKNHNIKNWCVIDDEVDSFKAKYFDEFKDMNMCRTCTFNGFDCFAMEKLEKIIKSWDCKL